MSLLEAALVLLAGLAAGAINTVVGAGTLLTFPTLLSVGLPPVLANVSNTVGLVPGSLSGAIGYRRELAGQLTRLVRLGSASLLGAVTGGILLLFLPADVFDAVVPLLIGIGTALVVVQPVVARRLSRPGPRPAHGSTWVWVLVYLTGVYGGYFGAAQGVLLVAILGIGLEETLQRVNAAKNVLALIVNAVAALLFIVVANIDWRAAALVAGGSVAGGVLGAGVGRRLPPTGLRLFVVAVGATAVVLLLLD